MFVVKSEFNFKFCLVIIYGLNKIFVLCELLVVLILLFFFVCSKVVVYNK